MNDINAWNKGPDIELPGHTDGKLTELNSVENSTPTTDKVSKKVYLFHEIITKMQMLEIMIGMESE